MVRTGLNQLNYHPSPEPRIMRAFSLGTTISGKKGENLDHLWKLSRLNYLWQRSTSHCKSGFWFWLWLSEICGFSFSFVDKNLTDFVDFMPFDVTYISIMSLINQLYYVLTMFGTTAKLCILLMCSGYFGYSFQKNAQCPVLTWNLGFSLYKSWSFENNFLHALSLFPTIFACLLVIMLVKNDWTGSFVIHIKA